MERKRGRRPLPPGEKKIKTSITIRQDLAEKIEKEAIKWPSKSEFIEHVIFEYFKNEEDINE